MFKTVKPFAVMAMLLALAVVALMSGTAHAAEEAASDWPSWLLTIGHYWEAVASVVGTAAIIAALTPTTRDDRIIGIISRFVDLLGANIGAAKNANDPKQKK